MVTGPWGIESQWDLGPMVHSQALGFGPLRPEGGLGWGRMTAGRWSRPRRMGEMWQLRADLGDSAGSVPDHHDKASIATKGVA